MGRYKTGASTVYDARQISITKLKEWNVLDDDYIHTGTMTWNNSSTISYKANVREKYIELNYTITSTNTKYSYRIELEAVPSNLGKGKILYFRCPENGTRCKILYMAYDSPIFKSRTAYKQRLFYPSQIQSKNSLNDLFNLVGFYSSDDYKQLEEKLNKKYAKLSYRGKSTKWFERYIKLSDKMSELQERAFLKNAERIERIKEYWK